MFRIHRTEQHNFPTKVYRQGYYCLKLYTRLGAPWAIITSMQWFISLSNGDAGLRRVRKNLQSRQWIRILDIEIARQLSVSFGLMNFWAFPSQRANPATVSFRFHFLLTRGNKLRETDLLSRSFSILSGSVKRFISEFIYQKKKTAPLMRSIKKESGLRLGETWRNDNGG